MVLRAAIIVLMAGLAPASLVSAQTSATPLFRVFLSDGSALASYGEWALVEGRVVFSMPIAPGAGPGELHLVSLPVERVDLVRTKRYADAVRAANYAATRGTADFAQLSNTVADTLNQIARVPDAQKRVAIAEQARRSLTNWPGAQHAYRAQEVAEILGVLDEATSGLRAAAGHARFNLALSASTVTPPDEPMLPAPDHSEVVRHLVAAAAVVESPAEKVSLLQSVVALIDRSVGLLPTPLTASVRSSALGELAEEQRIDGVYARLRSMTLADAVKYAANADVRRLEQLRRRLRDEDAKHGRRRPDAMAGVMATLESYLDEAHRLRLAHDQWLLSEGSMRVYRRTALPYIQALINVRESLDDIKLLAGPAPQLLRPLAQHLDRNARRLALLQPPALLTTAHAAFRSAYALAETALQLRRAAVDLADVELARQASAAAAGALLLLDRASVDFRSALQPPLSARSTAQP